jgi:OmpA-OmpF porin, OOP family
VSNLFVGLKHPLVFTIAPTITPFGSYIFSDSDRDADDGWGAGLAIGKPYSPYWNLEFRGMYEELDSESGGPGKYQNWSVGIDAHWFFLGRQGIRRWAAGAALRNPRSRWN